MLTLSFLGGLGDFGKNITLLETDDSILVVDCGSMFPESDVPGIDLIIPDFTYLLENSHKVAGLVLTHGHEDHIGAAPFLLKRIPMPVLASPLTLGFLGRKLAEMDVEAPASVVLEPGERHNVGAFCVEGIPVTHSVPDALSLAISTPEGMVVHSGDFKFDQSPLDGRLTHYHRFQEIGREGVMALLMDSTNVEVEGIVGSEVRVKASLERHIASQEGKLVIALFSTNLMRVQALYDLAALYGKKVALYGRSLIQNVQVGSQVGYLRLPPGVSIAADDVPDCDPGDVIVLTSGSQAEPNAALNRIAFGECKSIGIEQGDKVILSARIIPGNEKRVARVINQVYRRGGEVVTSRDDRVHVSGHAAQEEIKLMASWVRAGYYVPIHGEMRQLKGNAALARQMGYAGDRILVCDVGESLAFEAGRFVRRGEVPTGSWLIDGDSTDAVDRVVIRDRRHLSNDGVVVPIVVINRQAGRMESEPEIISRGYPYLEGGNGAAAEVRADLVAMVKTLPAVEIQDSTILKAKVKSCVKRTLKRNEARIPLIIPVVMEI
jgi:ribonuclease J